MADFAAGKCYIVVDGVQYMLRGEVSIMGFTSMKTIIDNIDGSKIVQTMPTHAKCSAVFTRNQAGNPTFRIMETLGEGSSANLTVSTEAGTFTFGDVIVTGEPSYDPEDGTLSVDFAAVGGFAERGRT